IFDRDGTLCDSLDVILGAFDHAIEPYTEKRHTREEWFAAFGPAEMDVIAKFIPAEKKQEAFNRFFDYYRAHFGEIHLYPGIRELLFELKRNGAKLMLFTGGGHMSTRFCLEQTRILHLFDALICGEDVQHPKPDPEGILKLMKEQNLLPGETIVVGDAASDVEAGKAAHAFTAWLCWSENAQSSELNVPPDFTCRSVDELRRVLVS
ncbi:HAD family hydrolase, partial [bacterium]|nr:HAD family hydrolase [bacterium]